MSVIRVLVVGYGGEVNPSTRLRILQFVPALEKAGFVFDRLFVPQRDSGQPIDGLVERIEMADLVFVQRVLTGELLRALRRAEKPVVFDMDDALHLIRQSQYPRAATPRGVVDRARNAYRTVARGSRFYSGRKQLLDEMLESATTTIVGNQWLFDELGLDEERAVLIPTSVWLNGVPTKAHGQHRPVTLGWIGVRSNLYHLEALREAFTVLRHRYRDGLELNIVSSAAVETPLATRFTPWSLETEGDSVLSFDIGIMPLQDDPFSRGKCAFKAVFCMSRGVPVVASPVGANASLIEDGVNGWLASSADEWVDGISKLAEDVGLRARMGRLARETIEADYAAESVARTLARLLDLHGRSTPDVRRGSAKRTDCA
jgi:glycosyltransferase involved in cell wall biosynthesis